MTRRNVESWRAWPAPTKPMTLRKWQNGRCAMCGYEDRLVRDHCHHTGLVRGLLCYSCNQWESDYSTMGDAWKPWRSGDHPANLLGVVEVYVSTTGQTPLDHRAALSYYTRDEQRAWWDSIPAALEAGEPWPAEAPWTESALAWLEVDRRRTMEALTALSERLHIAELFGDKARAS